MVLQSRSCTEVDELCPVVAGLEEGHAEIDGDGPERRLPGDRKAGRGAYREIVAHAGLRRARADRNIEMAERSEIAEQRGLHTVAVGQEGRQFQLRGADGEEIAADRARVLRYGDIARTDTRLGKAAERVAALEEALLDRDRLPVEAGDVAGLQAERPDERIVEHRMVEGERALGAQVFERSAETGEILRDREHHALGRLYGIVQRVVDEAVGNLGALRRTRRRDHLLRRIAERRDAIDGVGVAQADRAVFRGREPEAQARRGGIALVTRLGVVGHDLVEVDAGAQRLVEEVRLGEAELVLLGDGGKLNGSAQRLPAAEQVALRVAELTDERAGRGITGAERQLAGRLLGDGDRQVGAVGLAAGRVLDRDVLEEAERANAGPRAVDQHAIEGIALHQAEFPPDHLVERAGVADDVYLLDIDARSLVDLEDDVDRIVFAVAGDARMHFGKRVALGAGGIGERVDRLLDQIGVVQIAALDLDQR